MVAPSIPNAPQTSYAWGGSSAATDKLAAIHYLSAAQVNYCHDCMPERLRNLTAHHVNSNGGGTNTGSTLTVLSALAYNRDNSPLS